MQLIDLVKNAKDSTYKLQSLSTEIKNKALLEIADKLEQNKNIIFEANKKDLEYAKKLLDENKISLSMFNRLKLDENKMIDIISGIKDVVKLEDPINKVLLETELDDNLLLKKISCPIGLIAVIIEARPDVISQISSFSICSKLPSYPYLMHPRITLSQLECPLTKTSITVFNSVLFIAAHLA